MHKHGNEIHNNSIVKRANSRYIPVIIGKHTYVIQRPLVCQLYIPYSSQLLIHDPYTIDSIDGLQIAGGDPRWSMLDHFASWRV